MFKHLKKSIYHVQILNQKTYERIGFPSYNYVKKATFIVSEVKIIWKQPKQLFYIGPIFNDTFEEYRYDIEGYFTDTEQKQWKLQIVTDDHDLEKGIQQCIDTALERIKIRVELKKAN